VNVGAYLVGTIVVATVSARLTLVALIRSASACPRRAVARVVAATPRARCGLVLMGLGGARDLDPSPRVASARCRRTAAGSRAGSSGWGIGLGIVFAGQLSDAMRHGRGDESWRAVYRIEGFIGCRRARRGFRLPPSPRAPPSADRWRPHP
jgi:hypothetical protein